MNSAPSTHSHGKAVLLLVLVFILGAACGIGGGLLVLRRVFQHAIAHPGGQNAPVDRVIAHLESSIASELDLTAAERAAIRPELEQAATDFKALRAEVWRKAALNVQDTLGRVSTHLPPEKQTRLQTEAAKRLQPWGLMMEKP
ncbi:MAG: hypothetical protein Q8M07_20165 [Prosthecobacter sp.]|nr:hypothetical protein [Prosthecobacter sp.]HBJ82506.1 hypothetical protein [Verrucomicrobiales bacterium]